MATPQRQDETLAAVPLMGEPHEISDRPTPLPPPIQSPTTAHTRSPAILPKVVDHGPQTVQGWSKREFHKWQPPFYMTVFFLIGLSMSIAHCVFYPKLRGKLVGDSYQQEEKIRYFVLSSKVLGIQLTSSVSVPRLHSLHKSVSQRACGSHTHNGCGGQ